LGSREQDIGHYGRLVFAMVARHLGNEADQVDLLTRNPGFSAGDQVSVREPDGRRR
jgi:hypothetical protein